MYNTNSETEFIGGWLGDGLDKIGETITTLVVDGFIRGCIVILNFILEFGYWFCRCGILYFLLVYFCCKEQKMINNCIKLFFIYLIISVIGGVI